MGLQKPLLFGDSNFESEVLRSELPVLVDFWAEWCPPCRTLGPVIEELAADYDGLVKVGKLDIEESGETAAAFGVTSIPAVLLFVEGEVVETLVGAQGKSSYVSILDRHIAPQGSAAGVSGT